MGLFINTAYASLDTFLASVNNQIINPIIGFLFALAVVFFLWGMVMFLANQENDEKRTTGKSHMLWGIIGMAIMMGVFFFMNLILNTLGIQGIDPETGEVSLPDYEPQYPPDHWLKD